MTRISFLLALVLAFAGQAAASEQFTLDNYERMKSSDRQTLGMILGAMYETAVYAQGAIEHPEFCFTPVPIPSAELIAFVDDEVASPTGSLGREYTGNDHVALVLVNALQNQDVCR